MVFSIPQPAQKPWVVWVRSVLWEEKQVKQKEKGRMGKMLLLTFSLGFPSAVFCTSDLLQQGEANSRHADWPLALSSKTATSCATPCPFMGIFVSMGSVAVLPSHPAAEGPVASLEAGGLGECVPEPADLVTSACSRWTRVATKGEKEMKRIVRLILAAAP